MFGPDTFKQGGNHLQNMNGHSFAGWILDMIGWQFEKWKMRKFLF